MLETVHVDAAPAPRTPIRGGEEACVTPDQFRTLMGSFPTGVSIVTSCDADGRPLGYTASSVASVCLDPPVLLVCAASRLYTLEVIRRTGKFAINFLATANEDLARRFASRTSDKFVDLDYWLGELEVPLLRDAVGAAECRIHDLKEVGDHVVIFGRIIRAHVRSEQLPLIYFRGGFFGGLAGS